MTQSQAFAEKIKVEAENYAERVCTGQFPIEYTMEQVLNHTSNDFIEGANFINKSVLGILQENYEAAKRLTDEDKVRTAQELLLETYEDLIAIFSSPAYIAGRIQSLPDIEKVSCAFAEWIPENAVIEQDGYGYLHLKDLKPVTPKELFQQFLLNYKH